MAVTTGWFAQALLRIANGTIDLDNDSLKIAMIDNTYDAKANVDTLILWDPDGLGNNDPKASEVSGTGYTAGGNTVSGVTVSLVDDGSTTAWASSTSYDVGDIVRPAAANGYVYRCISAGVSAGSAPSWPTTKGQDVTDNTVTWENLGTSFVKFDFTDPSWTPNTTITARTAIVYVDAVAGTSDYVVAYIDFGQDESSTNGDFDIIVPADGLAQIATS
jgi:hypothetical protein